MCFISMDANRLFMALGLPHLMSYGYTNGSISNKHVPFQWTNKCKWM